MTLKQRKIHTSGLWMMLRRPFTERGSVRHKNLKPNECEVQSMIPEGGEQNEVVRKRLRISEIMIKSVVEVGIRNSFDGALVV